MSEKKIDLLREGNINFHLFTFVFLWCAAEAGLIWEMSKIGASNFGTFIQAVFLQGNISFHQSTYVFLWCAAEAGLIWEMSKIGASNFGTFIQAVFPQGHINFHQSTYVFLSVLIKTIENLFKS